MKNVTYLKYFDFKAGVNPETNERGHNVDKKRYKCDECGKGFLNNRRLSDHTNVHTGEKPYKCKFCSSCFASQKNHRIHERGHTDDQKKFRCDICGKGFLLLSVKISCRDALWWRFIAKM